MRGDFSRTTHRPNRHYSRVLLQQGRVLLDADWNEQVEIQLQAMRTMMADLVGPFGGPMAALAFKVDAEAPDDKLVLRVRPDRHSERNQGFSTPSTNGRYYVDGILVEQHEPVVLETGITAVDGLAVFVYLEVWEQHVTWIEENMPFKQRSMRDIGLGGPDSCSRSQVRWALRVMDVSKLRQEQQLQRALPWSIRSPLRMRAGLTKQDIGAGDPCRDTAQARYRGPENRLYRVEIHAASETEVTFKWSRENGSVVFPVEVKEGATFQDGALTLALAIPADPRFGLIKGNIVELVTEASDAAGDAGPLFEVDGIDDNGRHVRLSSLKESPATLPLGKWALLRRWDQRLDTRRENGSPVTMVDGAIRIDAGDRVMLEDGIYVQFAREKEDPKEPPKPKEKAAEAKVAEALRVSAAKAVDAQKARLDAKGEAVNVEVANVDVAPAAFASIDEAPRVSVRVAELSCRVGDYWLIPARTIPGDVEWPSEEFELPQGIARHHAPLAVVEAELGGAANEDISLQLTVRDLRSGFEPLAHQLFGD